MRTPHVPKAPHNTNMVTSADIDYFSSCNDYDYDIAPATSSFGALGLNGFAASECGPRPR